MSFLISFLVSSLLGFLSGLGVGGGSLLMVWLTLVCAMEYPAAKAINLIFFLPPAAISFIHHLRKKQLPVRKIAAAALAGCVCAAIFTNISSSWDVSLLRKLFGILLLATACKELFFTKAKK